MGEYGKGCNLHEALTKVLFSIFSSLRHCESGIYETVTILKTNDLFKD